MQTAKINDTGLRQRVIRVVNQTKQPVSIDFVATTCNMNWGTARAILFELSLNREISATKTTKSWIFQPRRSTE
jgi:hypothetical protein